MGNLNIFSLKPYKIFLKNQTSGFYQSKRKKNYLIIIKGEISPCAYNIQCICTNTIKNNKVRVFIYK
jgi:hypothetical protein